MNSTSTCPVQGNPELYGLGIRIALYLQILTAELSGIRSELFMVDDNIGHAVAIYILATGTVLLRLVLRYEIQAVEVVPILSLLITQLYVCRVTPLTQRITALILAGEGIGLHVLAAWFWFSGMDKLPRSCRDDYAFFFAKVSIWHWYRKLSQAFTLMSCIFAGFIVIPLIILFINIILLLIRGQMRAHRGGFDGADIHEEGSNKAVKTLKLSLEVGLVAFVEVALKWNQISGVHSLSSPSQYTPFFVALAQLVTTLYRLGKSMFIATFEEDSCEEVYHTQVKWLNAPMGNPRSWILTYLMGPFQSEAPSHLRSKVRFPFVVKCKITSTAGISMKQTSSDSYYQGASAN